MVYKRLYSAKTTTVESTHTRVSFRGGSPGISPNPKTSYPPPKHQLSSPPPSPPSPTFLYNPNKTKSGCVDFPFTTECLRVSLRASIFGKKIWEIMPPVPPSCYVLYTPSMSTPNFGVVLSPHHPDGVYETLSHLLPPPPPSLKI